MNDIINIWLLGFSLAAIWLVGNKKPNKWGYVCGLLSQPAWIYVGITSGNWSLLILSTIYTIMWARGLWNHRYHEDVV